MCKCLDVTSSWTSLVSQNLSKLSGANVMYKAHSLLMQSSNERNIISLHVEAKILAINTCLLPILSIITYGYYIFVGFTCLMNFIAIQLSQIPA